MGYRFCVRVVGKKTSLSCSAGVQLLENTSSQTKVSTTDYIYRLSCTGKMEKDCRRYLKRVTRWWRKTESSTLASSYPGHNRCPPPKGVNTFAGHVAPESSCSWIFIFWKHSLVTCWSNQKEEIHEPAKRFTCHLHGLKVRASLKYSWSKCTPRKDAKTFHPLGIV